MSRLKPALIILAIMIALLSIESAVSDVTSSGASSTQSNVSGSNTSIQGYEATTNNTYQGQVTNETTNSTSNSTNQETAVNSSSAPMGSVYGQDSCVIPLAAGVTVIGFSGSFGSYMIDKDCQLRKQAKLLNGLGMKVAAISLMCQEKNVFEAMMDAGTPCPYQGLIGEAARKAWLKNKKPINDKIEQYRKYKESLK